MYNKLDNICEKLALKYLKNEPMCKYTSFKIGGNADRFIEINTKSQLSEILLHIKKESLPFFILGNGSNLLVSDKGIRAVVLSLKGDFKKIELLENNVIRCGAGLMLSSLCNFAKDNSLSGLEFAFGIPGTAGGATYMNAGAYGGEMKDVVIKSEHFIDANFGSFCSDELDFSYRHSAYSDKNYIITDIYLKLEKADKSEIEEKMQELMLARKTKQPLEFPSAGSTFKRPVGYFAAALIEECGLKGFSLGGAQVSEKHSGFVINKGGATCKDVLDLANEIKKIVAEKKNVVLETEIKMIGEK
ncbi:MAG: UDP-N-acetylmuramate dehydrogenase [Clostridia bacterium]